MDVLKDTAVLLCPAGLGKGAPKHIIVSSPVLSALGSPPYVTMLTNLNKKTMLLVAMKATRTAVRLEPDADGICHIAAGMFVNRLCSEMLWSRDSGYLIHGQPTIVQQYKALLLDLATAQKLTQQEVSVYGNG